MASTAAQTDEVLATARKELQAQLELVRAELTRLTADERALTTALESLDGAGSPAAGDGGNRRRRSRSGPATRTRKASTRKASSARRTRRAPSKSTAERVEELRGQLADGPKSRSDLSAALNVSPARVQQLLAELGSSVTSKPVGDGARGGKVWSLASGSNGTGAAKATRRRNGARAKTTSGRGRSSRSKSVAK